MRFKALILTSSFIWSFFILSPAGNTQTLLAGFYNVENLFDLEDDPLTNDDEFTPNGRQKWTAERYQTKLDRISEVLSGMGLPDLTGLAEVENRKVCEDLIEQPRLKNGNYGIIHHDSPDGRGIDVALLFDKKVFKKISAEFAGIRFPDSLRKNPRLKYSTREILIAHLKMKKGKMDLYAIVVHAPSRSGGLKATEPLRRYVATQLRSKVDSIMAANPSAGILLMGDFNDEPDNLSISTDLHALSPRSSVASRDIGTGSGNLYNLVYEADQQGLGTYNYRGNWNMLDQFIVNDVLLNAFPHWEAKPYKTQKMMYKHDRFGEMPGRTYGGPNYYGGYSDHLPVLLTMKKG